MCSVLLALCVLRPDARIRFVLEASQVCLQPLWAGHGGVEVAHVVVVVVLRALRGRVRQHPVQHQSVSRDRHCQEAGMRRNQSYCMRDGLYQHSGRQSYLLGSQHVKEKYWVISDWKSLWLPFQVVMPILKPVVNTIELH